MTSWYTCKKYKYHEKILVAYQYGFPCWCAALLWTKTWLLLGEAIWHTLVYTDSPVGEWPKYIAHTKNLTWVCFQWTSLTKNLTNIVIISFYVSLLTFCVSPFHGGGIAVFQEMNCVCDHFQFPSHIMFLKVGLVCATFLCILPMVRLPLPMLGFLNVHVHLLMHAIAHNIEGSCVLLKTIWTLEESALKVDSGRKIPCCTGKLNLHQHHAGPDVYPDELHPCADSCFKSWLQSQTITRIKKTKMATFFEDLSRKFGAVRQ